jgi:hypothetical protein
VAVGPTLLGNSENKNNNAVKRDPEKTPTPPTPHPTARRSRENAAGTRRPQSARD